MHFLIPPFKRRLKRMWIEISKLPFKVNSEFKKLLNSSDKIMLHFIVILLRLNQIIATSSLIRPIKFIRN